MAALVALALYAAAGFWLVPRIVRAQLEEQLTSVLLRPATVAEVRFHPFDLRLEIAGLSVADHDAPRLVAFERLVVDVAARRLALGRLAFDEVTLDRPYARVALEPGGRLNVSDVLDALAAQAASRPPAPPEPPPEPPVVAVAKLQIRGGAVDFSDRSRAEPFAATVAPLEITMTDVSTERDRNSPYAFEARFDRDTRVAWKGGVSINPLRSSGELVLEGLHLESLAPYLREATQLVLERGVLSVSASYAVDASGRAPSARIERGRVSLAELVIRAPEAARGGHADDAAAAGSRPPVIAWRRASVDGIEVDVDARRVRTGSVTVEALAVAASRSAEGVVDLVAWSAPARAGRTATSSGAAPAAPAASAAPAPPPARSSTASAWAVSVAGFALRDGRVDFTDHGTARPLELHLDEVRVDTAPITVPLGDALPTRLSLRINQGGRLTVSGALPLQGGPLALDLALEDLGLALAQPYLDPVAKVELAAGTLSTRGKLEVSGGATRYAGELAVRGLSLREAEADREVLGLDELSLSALEISLPPVVARMDRLRLAGLRTQMIIGADGKSNFDRLAARPTAPAPAPGSASAPTPPPRVEIGALVLEKISANYVDRTMSPAFAVGLSALGGRVAPLRWPADRASKVELSGRVDAAPLTVKGTVRPDGARATLSLAIRLQGLDLVPASTYMAKYAGYPISKGKLSLDLDYALAARKLEGKNVVVVDQLTLGDKVESPDATWLPVKLGLAILTDRDGRMELDLPVGGDLDDPEFSLGKIIVRALVNVLEKVATSPFALLGAVVGGADELPPDRVSFAPGDSTLDPAAAAPLERVSQGVAARPALKLSVGGTYDPATDGPALARARLEAKLRDAGKRAGAKSTTVDAAAWAAQIRALHAQRFGARTGTRTPDLAQLEAEVLAGETPSAAELGELAAARARAVQAKLSEALGAERVFVHVPDPVTSGDRAVLLRIE